MSTSAPLRRRDGFVLVVVLLTMAIVLLFALVVARYAVLEFGRERQAALEACAEQVIESARDWSLVHPSWLTDGAPCQLPLETLLPPGYAGQLELQRIRASDGQPIVQCRIMLQRAGRRLRQQAEWPLVAVWPTRSTS